MAKSIKNISMPSTNRQPRLDKAKPDVSAAAARNGSTRETIGESTETIPKEETQPNPMLLYMARAVLKRRTEMGLTQLQLAHKAGCNSTAIFMVEGAKHNMTIKSVMLLAAAL